MAQLSTLIKSSLSSQTTVIVTGTAQTASVGILYILTNTSAATTLTLPASPSVGDKVLVSNFTTRSDTTVARNLSNIMQTAADVILDNARNTSTFQYVSSTIGWLVSSSRSLDSYSV